MVPLSTLCFWYSLTAVDWSSLSVLCVKAWPWLTLLDWLYIGVLMTVHPKIARGLLQLLLIFIEDVLLILCTLLEEHVLFLGIKCLLWRLGKLSWALAVLLDEHRRVNMVLIHSCVLFLIAHAKVLVRASTWLDSISTLRCRYFEIMALTMRRIMASHI